MWCGVPTNIFTNIFYSTSMDKYYLQYKYGYSTSMGGGGGYLSVCVSKGVPRRRTRIFLFLFQILHLHLLALGEPWRADPRTKEAHNSLHAVTALHRRAAAAIERQVLQRLCGVVWCGVVWWGGVGWGGVWCGVVGCGLVNGV